MKVSDSNICVAYYYKRKWSCIAEPLKAEDPRFSFEYIKRYVLQLTDRAKKTATQQRIRNEIVQCKSPKALLDVVDRVIVNGNKTEFVNYYK